MAEFMKGQRVTAPDGKVYIFKGGDDTKQENWTAEVSAGKDLGLSALSGGVQGIMDPGQTMASGLAKMGGPATGLLMDMALNKYRSLIPQWAPQTKGGRYAGSAARGAAGSSVAGPMGALSGAASGLGGEAGAEFTGGSRWGRLAGSIAGGLAPNLPGLIGGLTSRRIGSATEGIGPDDWAAAQRAQQQAQAQGIQVTGPEAIGQRAPDLLAKQLMVEQHPKSASIMAPMMNARPALVKGAVRGMLDDTGPAAADPALLGAATQASAKTAIDRARQAGNLAAGPSYKAAEAQRIPPSEWNTLTSDPVVLDALTKVKKNPYYGVAATEAEGSIAWLDAAKKYLDDVGESFGRTGANYAASKAGQGARDVRAMADATSQDYARARSIVEQNLRQNVEPRQLSATGALAETADPVSQFGRLTDPALSRPGVIAQTAKDIQPNYQQLVRHGLETQFDTAMKNLQTGGQQFGGARFERALRGTDQTRANIEATIGSLPNGSSLVKGWNNLLDTLALTGNRMPVGSRTAFNQLQAADMTGAGLVRQGLSMQPLGWVDRIEQNMSARKMANLFVDPESVKKMHELAVLRPDSAKARAIVSGLMGGQLTEKQ